MSINHLAVPLRRKGCSVYWGCSRWWSRCSGYLRSPYSPSIIHVANEHVDQAMLLIPTRKNTDPSAGCCGEDIWAGGVPAAPVNELIP